MAKFVVDASAWIEYLDGSPAGMDCMKIIEDEDNELLTSPVSVSEIVSKFRRQQADAAPAISCLRSLSKIIPLGEDMAVITGETHAQIRIKNPKFSFGDAAVLALARSFGARILTCDYDFSGVKEAMIIKKSDR